MSADVDDMVLALADDEMLMGHHHSWWICVAPFLEEDLAFCSIGQDELGHAHALYSTLTDDVDELALGREPARYRSAWLCELELPDWSDALVRHWLYDTAEQLRWEALADAGDDALAGLAATALREEAYHVRHAAGMVERLVGATDDARQRVAVSLDRLVPLAADLFEDRPDLYPELRRRIDALLAPAGMSAPWPDRPATGRGRSGVRSEGFQDVLDKLNLVRRLDPEADW